MSEVGTNAAYVADIAEIINAVVVNTIAICVVITGIGVVASRRRSS
jgi:hypothetical protein